MIDGTPAGHLYWAGSKQYSSRTERQNTYLKRLPSQETAKRSCAPQYINPPYFYKRREPMVEGKTCKEYNDFRWAWNFKRLDKLRHNPHVLFSRSKIVFALSLVMCLLHQKQSQCIWNSDSSINNTTGYDCITVSIQLRWERKHDAIAFHLSSTLLNLSIFYD